MVGRDREVVGAEALGCDLQVARRAVDRLLRIEALVHRRALGAQALDLLGVARGRDPLGQGDARLEVDAHPQQVDRGRGNDLGEAGCRLGRRAGAHVGTPGALEEDHGLERVRVDTVAHGRGLDLRPKLSGPLRRGDDAAGAHLVDHVGGARRRTGLELALARSRPGQRIGLGRRSGARLARDPCDPQIERLAVAEPEGEGGRRQRARSRDEQQHAGGDASEESPASLRLHGGHVRLRRSGSREAPTPDRHDARPRRVRGAGARARRRSEGERIQVRRHRRRRHLRLGDPLGEGFEERHGRDPDRAQGGFGRCDPEDAPQTGGSTRSATTTTRSRRRSRSSTPIRPTSTASAWTAADAPKPADSRPPPTRSPSRRSTSRWRATRTRARRPVSPSRIGTASRSGTGSARSRTTSTCSWATRCTRTPRSPATRSPTSP